MWKKYLPLRGVAQPLRVSSVSWLIASVESSPEIDKDRKEIRFSVFIILYCDSESITTRKLNEKPFNFFIGQDNMW